MIDLSDLTVDQLRIYKQHLIDEIKKLQKQTRKIDAKVKELLKARDNE